MTSVDLRPYIEHTLLSPTATRAAALKAAEDAARWGLRGLCVSPNRLQEVRPILAGTNVLVVTVVGFPSGAHASGAKAFEADLAVRDGAHEVDMVAPLGAIADRDWRAVARDVRAVVRAVGPGVPVKVILETSAFDLGRVVSAARAAVEGGAAFVKTSTGFGPGGASVAHVRALRRAVGRAVGVKASGGVRTVQQAVDLIEAGADRIGTSRGPALLG